MADDIAQAGLGAPSTSASGGALDKETATELKTELNDISADLTALKQTIASKMETGDSNKNRNSSARRQTRRPQPPRTSRPAPAPAAVLRGPKGQLQWAKWQGDKADATRTRAMRRATHEPVFKRPPREAPEETAKREIQHQWYIFHKPHGCLTAAVDNVPQPRVLHRPGEKPGMQRMANSSSNNINSGNSKNEEDGGVATPTSAASASRDGESGTNDKDDTTTSRGGRAAAMQRRTGSGGSKYRAAAGDKAKRKTTPVIVDRFGKPIVGRTKKERQEALIKHHIKSQPGFSKVFADPNRVMSRRAPVRDDFRIIPGASSASSSAPTATVAEKDDGSNGDGTNVASATAEERRMGGQQQHHHVGGGEGTVPAAGDFASTDGGGRATMYTYIHNHVKQKQRFPVLDMTSTLETSASGLILFTDDELLRDAVVDKRFQNQVVEKVCLVEVFGRYLHGDKRLKSLHLPLKYGDDKRDMTGLARVGVLQRRKLVHGEFDGGMTSHKGWVTVLQISLSDDYSNRLRIQTTGVGIHIKQIHRERVGPIFLADLPEGSCRYLTNVETVKLYKTALPKREFKQVVVDDARLARDRKFEIAMAVDDELYAGTPVLPFPSRAVAERCAAKAGATAADVCDYIVGLRNHPVLRGPGRALGFFYFVLSKPSGVSGSFSLPDAAAKHTAEAVTAAAVEKEGGGKKKNDGKVTAAGGSIDTNSKTDGKELASTDDNDGGLTGGTKRSPSKHGDSKKLSSGSGLDDANTMLAQNPTELPGGIGSVYDILPSEYPQVQQLMMLESDESGIALFTDDPVLHRSIVGRDVRRHGQGGLEACYMVQVECFDGSPQITPAHLQSLRQPMQVPSDGSPAGRELDVARPPLVTLSSPDSPILVDLPVEWPSADGNPDLARRHWLKIVVYDGRRRFIRRMCTRAGLHVLNVVRYAFGTISLEGLVPGTARSLSQAEVTALYKGCDLDPASVPEILIPGDETGQASLALFDELEKKRLQRKRQREAELAKIKAEDEARKVAYAKRAADAEAREQRRTRELQRKLENEHLRLKAEES